MRHRPQQSKLAQHAARGAVLLAVALFVAALVPGQQRGNGKQSAPPPARSKQPVPAKVVPPQGTATTPAGPAKEWKVGYFYDDDREVLHFADLAFPSLKRGIAVGTIVDETREASLKPVAMITGDGGATWNRTELDDIPVSLYFLNDSSGWMVTSQGIWKTEESGRSWKRVSKHKRNSIARVWFLDNDHGFAVGVEKTVLETLNGGKQWTPVKAAAEPTGRTGLSIYDQVAFADGRHGIILGASVSSTSRLAALSTMELETHDGGTTWKHSAAVLSGHVTGLTLNGVDGLVLFANGSASQFPSEVYHVDLQTGKSVSAFHRNDRVITGLALFPGRRAFLAATVTRPKAAASLPGPIKILSSTDFTNWSEIDVDYRATGTRVVLAGFDADHMWAATDTGMLLQAP